MVLGSMWCMIESFDSGVPSGCGGASGNDS